MKEGLSFIRETIARHLDLSEFRIFVFGSRARGTASRFSDYDVAIVGREIPAEVYFAIESDFENSDFPFRVDLVPFRDVSSAFRKMAEESIIELN
jgi:predicted nucleotidyltransferase